MDGEREQNVMRVAGAWEDNRRIMEGEWNEWQEHGRILGGE